ncbi:MAG: O-antigen ligase family protein [Parcubacteria group bacterium]|nr:O-antigen ligase family protein [Parcubacteria group bacterium]
MKDLEKYCKYIAYTVIFLIPFIVFIVDYSQLFPFITGKNFLFRFLIEIAFGAWMMLALLNEKYRPKKSILLTSVIIFVGLMFVANILGVEPRKSFWSNLERMDGWITLIHLLVYTLVLSSLLNTKRLWKMFWNTTIIASFGVGLFAVSQLARRYFVEALGYSLDHGILSILPIINQGGVRLDATFGNSAYLAVYMLLHIFITVAMLIKYHSVSLKMRIMYLAALVLQFISLYYSGTRGSILGLIGGMLLISILFVIFEPKSSKLKKTSIALLVIIFLMTGTFFLIKDSEFIQSQRTLQRLASISLESKTVTSRFLMWNISFEGFKEEPILGYGQGNFKYVFNKHYDPRMYDQEPWFDRAHNVFFDWLIEGGLIGLMAYIFIWFALVKLLIKSSKITRREKIIYLGMLSAYLFNNMFVFDQITSYMFFFAFIAYIHSLEGEGAAFKKVFSIEEGSKNRIAIPILILLTIVTPFMLNAKGYLQSTTFIKALSVPQPQTIQELNFNTMMINKQLKKTVDYNSFGTAEVRQRLPGITNEIIKSPNINESLKQEIFLLTKDGLEKQIKETPNDTRYYMLLGNFLANLGFLEESTVYFKDAIQLSPNKQVLYSQLAEVYGMYGNYEKMFEYAQKGYSLNEENESSRSVYALALKSSGREDLHNTLIKE